MIIRMMILMMMLLMILMKIMLMMIMMMMISMTKIMMMMMMMMIMMIMYYCRIIVVNLNLFTLFYHIRYQHLFSTLYIIIIVIICYQLDHTT